MTREAPELRSSLDLPPPLSRQDAGFLQRRVAQVVTHRRLMLFEADPPKQEKTRVEINKPDPKEHPDAYDAKGELVDMYKDPDMGLGFAEQITCYPDPHTKYDKFWVGPVPATATVQQLRDTINEAFADHCHQVSYADFLVIAAEAVMIRTRPDYDEATMTSRTLSFDYLFGRTTVASCSTADFVHGAGSGP